MACLIKFVAKLWSNLQTVTDLSRQMDAEKTSLSACPDGDNRAAALVSYCCEDKHVR
jgi:hypothetical protein